MLNVSGPTRAMVNHFWCLVPRVACARVKQRRSQSRLPTVAASHIALRGTTVLVHVSHRPIVNDEEICGKRVEDLVAKALPCQIAMGGSAASYRHCRGSSKV